MKRRRFDRSLEGNRGLYFERKEGSVLQPDDVGGPFEDELVLNRSEDLPTHVINARGIDLESKDSGLKIQPSEYLDLDLLLGHV